LNLKFRGAARSVFYAFLLVALISAVRFSPAAEERPELKKLAEGVYARIVSPDGDAVANAGVVVLNQSVLIFDTHFTPEAGRELLGQVRSISSKPIRYVVNSHFHPDHTHGNQALPGAQIIGSTLTRRDVLGNDLASLNQTISVAKSQLEKLRRESAQNGAADQTKGQLDQIKKLENYLDAVSRLKIMPPVITLDDSLIIQEGKQEVQLLCLGAGHTEGDTVLFLPREKIAFLGDLFFNEAIPNVQDASMLGWIKTLREALKLNADIFIPGHGSLGSRKDVEAFLGYLEDVKSLVEEAIDRGDSKDTATQGIQVPAKYSSYQFQNFFPLNIQKMFSEIKSVKTTSIPTEASPKKENEKAK
jgi:cyclase